MNDPLIYNSVQFKLAMEKKKLELNNMHVNESPLAENPAFRGSMTSKASS